MDKNTEKGNAEKVRNETQKRKRNSSGYEELSKKPRVDILDSLNTMVLPDHIETSYVPSDSEQRNDQEESTSSKGEYTENNNENEEENIDRGSPNNDSTTSSSSTDQSDNNSSEESSDSIVDHINNLMIFELIPYALMIPGGGYTNEWYKIKSALTRFDNVNNALEIYKEYAKGRPQIIDSVDRTVIALFNFLEYYNSSMRSIADQILDVVKKKNYDEIITIVQDIKNISSHSEDDSSDKTYDNYESYIVNNNDVELITNQNSDQKEVGLSNDQMVDKEKHTTVKRVLNFGKSVSKTIHLTESSEKIENNLKQDIDCVTINGNGNTGKSNTISSIQNDYTLSSDNLRQKEHEPQYLLVHKNTVTREEFGAQHNVPADGNCLFWSIFYAYLLPVRKSHEEFKERFKKMFPGRSDLHNVSSLQNKFQSLELNNLNTQVEDFIPLIQELRKRAYDEVKHSISTGEKIHVTPTKNKEQHIQWTTSMADVQYNKNGIISEEKYWGEEKAINALACLLDINIVIHHSITRQQYPANLNKFNSDGTQILLPISSDIEITLKLQGKHYNFYYKDIQWNEVDSKLNDTRTSKMEDNISTISSENNYSRKEESTYDEFDSNGQTITANSNKSDLEQKSKQEENTCTTTEVYRPQHFNNDFENKSYKSLHDAAKNGDISVVNDLLTKGTDVNALDQNNWTALHFAARSGHDNVVKLLLDHNAKVDATTLDNWTALHLAARSGHDNVVKLLLDHNAKVDATTLDNWTALHLAAYYTHISVIYILLKYQADINITNDNGYTPLNFIHLKIYHNKEKLLAIIIPEHDKGYNYETKSYFIKIVQQKKIFNITLKHIDNNDSIQFFVVYDSIDTHINAQQSILIKEGLQNTPLDIQYSNEVLNVEVIINKLLNNNDKEKLLHLAATEKGYSHVVKALLTEGIDVNALDHKRLTALHLAARHGYDNIVEMLLEHNADIINTQNSNGSTALHLAAINGNDNIVQLLLKHGANVGAPGQWTALHYAARNGNDGIVAMLLEHNADIINTQNSNGSTALHLAAINKCVKVIQVLLQKEANINIANNDGYTPAHYLKYLEHLKLENLNIDHLNLNTDVNNMCLAVITRDISVVNTLLLTEGVDVNALDHKGWTALHYAARNGNDNIVQLLLKHGANVNVITPDDGWTALHLAAINKCVKVIQVLLQKEANINIANNDGYTPAHYLKYLEHLKLENLNIDHLNLNTDVNNMCLAVITRDISVVNTLLLTEGVDVNALDHKGWTALHYAARNGNDNIVQLLLKHGANVNVITPDDGWTALHLAAINKCVKVIQVLLQKEANINIANNDGYTPAHYLKYLEHLKLENLNIDHLNLNTDVNNMCLAVITRDISVVNTLLLTEGVDVNALDHKGWTALHYAARNGNDGIVAMLLEHNADIINTQNSNGSTALHLAAINKCVKVIQVLLQKEANINIANNDGYTPAHYLKYLEHLKLENLNIDHLNLNTDVNNMCLAVITRDISVVNTLLLTEGVDVNALDHKGWTALHYAARNGNDNIVQLLLKHGANVNVITPDDGWTALHFAARNGYDGIVEVLLKHNADIINIQTSCGSTALHLAAKNKHIAVIQVLLKKEADINIANNDGYTPYSLALIQYYHPEIINLFQLKQQISKTKLLHTDYTEGLGNCFFHAVFGEKNSQSKLYEAEKAKEMREEWYNFLKQFEAQGLQDSNMPAALKDQLKKVFRCFLDNSTDFTSISDEIKVLVDNTNQAIIKAKYEIEELRNEITQKFQDDEEFRNEIHQIISQAREKTGQQAPNIQELLNDNMSLTNEISNALEECVLKFNSNLNHKTYSDQYNAQVIVDSFLDNPEVYSNYLEAIKQNSYYVFFEEIPILSSLANIKIQVYYDNGNEQKTIQCDPQQELRGSYPLKPEVWGNKEKAIISHSGMHFKHTSFSDFQQPALHEKQNLNAYMHTQDEKIVDIFYKKIKKYKFEKWNIDIEIREVQHSYFLIEELHLKRICTKNEGNHILPVSTICNLIKKFIEISKKNPVNDYIKVAEKLLSTFISNTHIHDEIQTYYNHLRDMMLNKKREKLSTINDLKVFLEHNLIPFILYVWDNRITSNFYEKRTKKALGQEGANIKLVNQKIMTLFNNENSDLQQYQVQMKSIREALLSTIDLPIIITHGLEELRQDDIDKYFNCIMLFLVKNLIVTIKNGTYANTLLYMEELNASIKSLKNLDNDSPLKDLQKIVGISNEQSTLDIEHTIEKIKSHGKLNNSIFNIIRILEAIHIENNINEVLQDQNLHFIYGMYISFIEKKDKSNLIKIRDNVESYKQKLESEPSNAVNDKYVLELTTIFEIIKVWNEYNVDVRLGDNEQQSVRNIVKEYLDSIAYDIVKLLHICTSIIECTSISHYEFNSEYTNIRNNLLKITSCGKELIEHHSNDISNLRRGMLKKICEELSDNDYSVYLSSDTGSVQDNHDLSNDDIAELQDMSCSQLLSLLQSSASYSSDDIMTIMQHKWKEEDLKVFLDKDALLEAVKNKPIQYVIFIQKDDKSELVHDARIIITESNGQVIEIPIVVQDKNNIKSFFDGSELAEYNTNSYNNHYISLPLMFNEIVNKLFYALDKPEMNKNITNVLTIYSDLPYYENSVINIFCKKVESYMKQINYFLQKLHKGESNYDCYNEFSTYLKENSGTQIMGKTIEQYYNHYIKINLGFIKALKLNSIIQYCNKHSGLENVQDFIKRIQTTLKENVYKGIDYVEAMGLDLESIRHNIHMINQDINQTVVDIDDNRMKLLFNNINCLKILGIKNYQDGNHAIVFVKNTNGVSIIDPLNKNSSFSNSLEKLANNLLSLGIKFINIIYSGLQQPNSGVCADISLILVKNLADKLPDVQSVQDIIEIIQDIRIKMYGKASEKNQEAITIKSFDAINTLTKLDSCAVGIQDKEKQQDNYYANNEFINTLQQDGFLIKPVELIGNVL